MHNNHFPQASSALVVGCGGLGCPAAAYLAGAGLITLIFAKRRILKRSLLLKTGFMHLLKNVNPGVGRIGVIDHDTVEVSNLHRQVLHTQSRIGVSKAASLAASLAEINSSIEVVVAVLYPRRRNNLL